MKCARRPPRGRTSSAAWRDLIAFALAAILLSACTSTVQFPLDPEGQQELGDDVEVIVLDATTIVPFTTAQPDYARPSMPSDGAWIYRVGTGDILSIIVFDHPELTLPAGPQRSAEESGFQVANDGTFTYPYIGRVVARGRTVDDIRSEIASRLAEFIPDPQVDVRVAAYNSQFVTVSGEVRGPSRLPITTVPLTLAEALNSAGGPSENADLRRVKVQRGGRTYTVDIRGFLEAGIAGNNPLLRHGDVIFVPRRPTQEAYILGEVSRPDVVDLSLEPVTLTQALARKGGLRVPEANARGVLVFREHEDKMRVFQLDTTRPDGLLLGTKFILEPGDVVYVLRSPLQKWNDVIAGLLPSVQGVNAVRDLEN